MKRWIFLLSFLSCVLIGALSQYKQPVISFVMKEHNFGSISENGGSVSYKFEFTNTGSAPLIVSEVKPSCGCTTPEWSREPIVPGRKGFIDVTFNPKGRPGQFNKSIAVKSNASEPTETIYISGTVLQETISPEKIYTYNIGSIRFRQRKVLLGEVHPGGSKSGSIDVYNSSADSVSIYFDTPKHIKITMTPQKIAPEKKARLDVRYSATAKNEWGNINYEFNPVINNVPAKETIDLIVKITDDFSKLTPEQLANAPVISFNTEEADFKTIKKGDKFEFDFVIKNNGKSTLNIHKVESSCGCTVPKLNTNELKPGQSTVLKVIFDSKEQETGVINKSITIFSNDPAKNIANLHITGNVIE